MKWFDYLLCKLTYDWSNEVSFFSFVTVVLFKCAIKGEMRGARKGRKKKEKDKQIKKKKKKNEATIYFLKILMDVLYSAMLKKKGFSAFH